MLFNFGWKQQNDKSEFEMVSNLLGGLQTLHKTNRKLNSIQFKIICIALFTIQSLQSSFTGNEVSTIYLYIVET